MNTREWIKFLKYNKDLEEFNTSTPEYEKYRVHLVNAQFSDMYESSLFGIKTNFREAMVRITSNTTEDRGVYPETFEGFMKWKVDGKPRVRKLKVLIEQPVCSTIKINEY